MGEAKRRKAHVASGGEDWGGRHGRRRFKNWRFTRAPVGLVDAGFATRGEERRRVKDVRKHTERRVRVLAAQEREKAKPLSRLQVVAREVRKGLTSPKGYRQLLRAAGGVAGPTR